MPIRRLLSDQLAFLNKISTEKLGEDQKKKSSLFRHSGILLVGRTNLLQVKTFFSPRFSGENFLKVRFNLKLLFLHCKQANFMLYRIFYD